MNCIMEHDWIGTLIVSTLMKAVRMAFAYRIKSHHERDASLNIHLKVIVVSDMNP